MKALQTNQRGGNTCDETLRTLYMTLFHTRCSHEQNDKTYLMGAIVPHCKPKSGKTDGKKRGAPILGTVAISGNTLVAVDFSGNVYAFVSQ